MISFGIYNLKHIMKKLGLVIFAIALTLSILPTQAIKTLNDFGMNKPHLLFHLGERKSVSVNYGIGYWLNNPQSQNKQYFTRSRLWYENTNNGLYVNMISHDGDAHIHEKIEDRTFDVETEVKYQLLEEGWEQKLEMRQVQAESSRFRNHSAYWMTYMTVENNDPKLIDHKEYSTTVTFSVSRQEKKTMEVSIDRSLGPSETISIHSKEDMRVFGFTMNTSQSYDVRSFMEEVKHLVEVDKYKNVKRKNDSGLVDWENNQLKLIKKNQWTEGKFVILVFYGEFKGSNEVFITNGTSSQFKEQRFLEKSKNLNQTYFPAHQYPLHSEFLRHILFNLHGGTSFYYGILYTQNSLLKHELDYSYTFTPSRLIFPRGFLWDDGFHLSVAVLHHPDKVIHVLHNWMRKIDLFGWIGREQIRGFEISSMMPELKFVYQDIFEMNPPTLVMPLLKLIELATQGELSTDTEASLNALLRENYWKLEKWYRYFVKTQSHNNLMENEAVNRSIKYRWRCKDDCERGNFMGSGLDDYPRTATETQISKQHVDLMSWIYFFSEGLEKIAEHLGLDRPQRYYREKKEEVRRKIIEECLDPVDLLFKDQSVAAKNQYINELVTRVGYINLFPFFTGVLREELYGPGEQETIRAVIDKIVSVIGDEKQLLSEGGIRSLSISDSEYGTLDNYWRGSVWLPINYMVLRACKRYYWDNAHIREVYGRVRGKLIESVYQNWKENGYLYENYREGKGNRGFPFYGWTSLIANIITEQY